MCYYICSGVSFRDDKNIRKLTVVMLCASEDILKIVELYTSNG